MPRYHIDTDTLIACCLSEIPEASFSFHDIKQIITITANAQNRYLFCDTTPAAVQKVVDKNKTIFFFYTDFSVALKNPEADLPLKMFSFGYDESLIRSIQKAAADYLRSKASNIAAKYLETHGMNESVSDISDEGATFLVTPGGTSLRPLRISKKTWKVIDEEEKST